MLQKLIIEFLGKVNMVPFFFFVKNYHNNFYVKGSGSNLPFYKKFINLNLLEFAGPTPRKHTLLLVIFVYRERYSPRFLSVDSTLQNNSNTSDRAMAPLP